MPDDLDDLVRRTMKTLDDQVPSGYFEALPNRTLARLEGKDMQSTTGTSERNAEVQAPPPAAEPKAKERDEDSGLHDIRSLAQSTKQRLSNKRVTSSPVRTDDDILASTSASWKGVALPEPAKMVSLPSIDELPSKKEIIAKEKAARKQAAADAAAPARAPAIELPVTAPAPAAATSQRFANITQRKKSKAPLAIAGVLVAAAAGVALYMATQQKSESKPAAANDTTVAIAQTAPAAAPAAAPAPPPEPPKVAEVAPADAAVAEEPPQQIATAEVATKPEAVKGFKHAAPKSKAGPSKIAKDTEEATPPPVEKKSVDDKKKPPGAKGSGEEGEPSFDALLKEAGVDQTKKEKKPVLANKSLSGGDFHKGMDAVQSKAQACYKGTQGSAQFKLSVAPSGKVASVTMLGQFKGKPEAACVEAAVRSASFPPWDGGPQTFSYSYLLAE